MNNSTFQVLVLSLLFYTSKEKVSNTYILNELEKIRFNLKDSEIDKVNEGISNLMKMIDKKELI